MKKSLKGKAMAALLALGMFSGVFSSCSFDVSESGSGNLGLLALVSGDGSSGGSGSGSGALALTTSKIPTTAPSTPGEITVSGGASYSGNDINAAWSAVQSATGDVTMTLAAGTYEATSQLSYSGSYNVKISGDSSAAYGTNVLIHGNLNTNSQRQRELLYMTASSSGSLTIEYVTIKNDFAMTSSSDVQAEAVATDGTGNLAAYNCSFLSGQDTIRTVAKAWFYKCYIEGDVDFLWMETTGSVALYEECVIRAIADRVSNAYIAAPRMSIASKSGKGLVIYKSKIEAESGLGSNFYLGRNPWASSALSSYYNQVAIVDSPLYAGSGTSLNATVWKSASNGTADKQYVGFKTDDYYAASTKTWGARLSYSVKSAEYCGRKNILNRLYNSAASKFTKDSENEWDIDAVITTNNWSVTADTSSSLLAGETENSIVTYDFTSSGANGWTAATVSNFSSHSSGSAIGNANATITIPVNGKCVVYVTGFYSGNGSISAGSQGEVIYSFNTGSTGVTAEKSYVVYDSSATSVVITASSSTYITKVVVEYDNTLSYVPVTGISVSADSSTYTVGVPVNLSATVTPASATNKDIKWTSSDTNVATVNEFTGAVTFAAAGSVTFTATARDGSGSTASITCNPTAATWTSAEWYDSKDSSSITASGNGASLGGSAGTNNSVFTLGTTSGVTLGGNKTVTLIDGTTKNISTGLKMNSNGTISFSVTESAKLTVLAGYCSDNNITNDTVGITASNGGSATAWRSNPSGTPTADAEYTWTITAGTYKLVRGGSGYAPSIYYVRVDIGDYPDTSSAIAVSSISVKDSDDNTSSSIATGGTVQLTATVTPSNATDSTVTWSSSSDSVATVTSSGVVRGVSAGNATITATANDGSGVTGTYAVTVTNQAASTVISTATTISFGTSGNYASVSALNTSNANVRDNGGNNSQISGRLTFDVLSGAEITVSSYSGYTSYTLSDGTTTSGTQTGTSYTYTATSDCTITIECGSNNYFYSIAVAYPVSTDTFFDLRTLFSGLPTSNAASSGSSNGLTYTSMYYKDAQHGAWFYNGSTLSFKVSGACTVYLGKDQYNAATYTVSDGTNSSVLNATASSTLGTSVTSDMSSDSENPSFTYTGSGVATITISVTGGSGSNYLPAVQVKF